MMVVMVIAIAVASIVVCVLSSLTPVSDVCPTFMNVSSIISVLHLPSICRNSVTSAEVGAMPDPVVTMGGPKEVAVTMKRVIIVR